MTTENQDLTTTVRGYVDKPSISSHPSAAGNRESAGYYGSNSDLLGDCQPAMDATPELRRSSIDQPGNTSSRPTKAKVSVLIIDDDFVFGKILCHHLHAEGYNCTLESDHAAIYKLITDGPSPDIFILDNDLGNNISGLDLCRMIKSRHERPVIMLTADDSETTTVNCLDAGADQYIVKPYKTSELLARMRSAVRSYSYESSASKSKESSKPLTSIKIDRYHRVLRSATKSTLLTEKETMLLEFLFANIGVELSRESVNAALYGSKPMLNSRTIDVLMGRIRKKLKFIDSPYVINNLRNFGYILYKPMDSMVEGGVA